ncbi:hypothetical protein VKT23_003715 [Stygiomarasmius scandens]|uniref:Transcription factor CBF/NF-Y/archaeal histone domain-containing protein n=1 Tax=Marasmiellus scandens TaxID=2682957 RepID=A0ABR1K0V2_9AGAR
MSSASTHLRANQDWQHQPQQQDMHSEDDAEEQVEEEEIEENEEDEEVDQLVDEDESAEDPDDTAEEDPPGPSSRAGRIPGQTLLPAVRLENIMQADGVTGSLAMSREGMFILSAATEEFIKRITQGGHREATAEGRSTIHYHDMANTTRQYQEFMFLQDIMPTPMSLTDALELREAREKELFNDDPSQAQSTSTAHNRAYNPNTMLHPSLSSMSHTNSKPKKSRSANGKEKANGSTPSSRSGSVAAPHHSHVIPPSVSVGPGAGPSVRGQWVPGHGVLDARPWTHWAEPQVGPGGTFVNTHGPGHERSAVIVNGSAPGHVAPSAPATSNGHPPSPSISRSGPTPAEDSIPSASASVPPTSSSSSSAKDSRPGSGSPVETTSDRQTPAQFTGPASGYLQGPGGPSPFSRPGANQGRTIYSQQG